MKTQTQNEKIEALIYRGKLFNRQSSSYKSSLVNTLFNLRDAKNYAGEKGFVASMPMLIAGKANAYSENYLHYSDYNKLEKGTSWMNPLSEEIIGIDREGSLGKKENKYLFTLHGTGLVTPTKAVEAVYGTTKEKEIEATEEEIRDLIKGKIHGENIPLYTLEDIKKDKIKDISGKFAIYMDIKTARNAKSDIFLNKKEFMKNPIALARGCSIKNLEKYFDTFTSKIDKNTNNKGISVEHYFKKCDNGDIQFPIIFQNGHQFLTGHIDNGSYVAVREE